MPEITDGGREQVVAVTVTVPAQQLPLVQGKNLAMAFEGNGSSSMSSKTK